jgi:hypothetical protein
MQRDERLLQAQLCLLFKEPTAVPVFSRIAPVLSAVMMTAQPLTSPKHVRLLVEAAAARPPCSKDASVPRRNERPQHQF